MALKKAQEKKLEDAKIRMLRTVVVRIYKAGQNKK